MVDIVRGLFGVDPQSLQQANEAGDFSQAYKFAQLTPMQRANLSLYQGGAGLTRGIAQLLGGDEQLNRATQLRQLASQVDLTSPEGLQQYAQLAASIDPNVAVTASAEAERRRALGLSTQRTEMDIARTQRALSQEEKLREELAKLPANATEQQYLEVFRKFGSPDQQSRMIQASLDRRAAIAARQAASGNKPMPMTPAQKSADMAFGKDYNDFVAGGGISSIQKNLSDLDRAIQIIEDAKKKNISISGKMVGLADSTGTLPYVFKEAADVKDLVGGVAQSNLRQVLGGQFAQKEGEALLARAYNPALPVDDNLKRLRSLRNQISTAANAKIQAVGYFEENGTLTGFKPGAFGAAASNITGQTPTAEDPLGLRKR